MPGRLPVLTPLMCANGTMRSGAEWRVPVSPRRRARFVTSIVCVCVRRGTVTTEQHTHTHDKTAGEQRHFYAGLLMREFVVGSPVKCALAFILLLEVREVNMYNV